MTVGEGDHNPLDLIAKWWVWVGMNMGDDQHTGGIEQAECIGVFANHDRDGIVVKHLLNDPGFQLDPVERGATERDRTVGTYSLGNLFVVYEINRQVCGSQR